MFILIFGSCSDSTDNSLNCSNSTDLFPLAIGNYWRYLFRYYDEKGMQILSDTTIISIDSYMEIDTKTYYYTSTGSFIRNGLDGYYIYQSNTDQKHWLWYKYPSKPGESIRVNKGVTYIVDVSLIKNDTIINCTGRDFCCYKYKENYYTHNGKDSLKLIALRHVYISPGFGFVKYEGWDKGFLSDTLYRSYISVLAAYSVK